MNPDRDTKARGWLALSCASDGTIERIVRDDLGFAHAGARLQDVVDRGSARKAETFIAALRAGECLTGWQLNVPAAESARPLSFSGAAVGDGSLLILAGPAALITDNQLYEELSRLNNDLINRERELARKSAALERLSAEKSRLVAMAAHDLRNPLTIIAAYADLLNMGHALPAAESEYVHEISRAAHFMMELVEEMLDSSQLESGRVEVHLRDVDLVDAARHAATVNRMRAERKQITIRFEALTELAIISADTVKLRQIINNLVVNAIKFSRSGSEVTIRVRRTAECALLEVEDHGIGIPRDHLATIFEAFTTIGAHGTAGEKSTGLGLTIVKQLAELHRAAVDVESEEGRGSLFRVSFPLQD